MKKTARLLAVEALHKVHKEGAYSNLTLDSLLEASALSPRDRALATALFYGVLERQLTLDGCIARYSKLPLQRLDGKVAEILRISLYQLLYLDSVPDSAAVSEGVELTRTIGKTSASGFVNGVLRAFLRDDKKLPISPGAPVAVRFGMAYSAPQWLVEHLITHYGEEDAEGILAASLGKPPLTLRQNPLRISREALMAQLEEGGITVTGDEALPHCLTMEGAGDLTKLPAYGGGLFHVQDRASQFCCAALDVRPGMRVLDVCAAPGGKSFTLAQMMENRGELFSCDLHENRVGLIRQGAQRLGIGCIKAAQNDATKLDVKLGYFDRVLCDVPCSGLGIIRRKPEIKYKDPKEFETLPPLQYKILETSANYVDEDGILLYSTCTLNPRENEEVVARFLSLHPEFVPAPLPEGLGAGGSHQHTLLPHKGGTDGFFIATVRRLP